MTSTLQQEKEKVEESPIQQQQQQEKVVGEHALAVTWLVNFNTYVYTVWLILCWRCIINSCFYY